VLHIQVRDARIKAGISRAELARRAGISRARLVKFEETGANITVDTLTAILEQLPIMTLTIGNATIVRGDVSARELVRSLHELVEAAQQVIQIAEPDAAAATPPMQDALQAPPPATPAQEPKRQRVVQVPQWIHRSRRQR